MCLHSLSPVCHVESGIYTTVPRKTVLLQRHKCMASPLHSECTERIFTASGIIFSPADEFLPRNPRPKSFGHMCVCVDVGERNDEQMSGKSRERMSLNERKREVRGHAGVNERVFLSVSREKRHSIR